MKSIKRIVEVYEVKGFSIYCRFNNGESRVIDFEKLFSKWQVKEGDFEYAIKESKAEFRKVELVDGTLTWRNIEIDGKDDEGNAVTYFYDLDPIVLYENSELDKARESLDPQLA